MIISRPVRIVKNVGTKLATCDPESHRIARDERGHIYFSFIDREGNVCVARSHQPNQLTEQCSIQRIFGYKGLLGDLRAAKFGPSLVIDKEHSELSLLVCERNTHSCIYTRCRLRKPDGIADPENWYSEGKPNPSKVGYAKIGSTGEGNQSLCTVEHDNTGNALVSFSAFTENYYSVKFTKFQDGWLPPITMDQDEDYCWASSLYLDRDDFLHIAYESYKDNTVRHRQTPLEDCMDPAEWRSANKEEDFDHALHHRMKPCRAFSMRGDKLGQLYFVGHTSPRRQTTTDVLFNILDTKKGKWLFEKEDCGKISAVGLLAYAYPQIGILAETPVIVYTREGSDGRLHVVKNFNESVYIGPTKTYYPCIERENIKELTVVFTRKSLLSYSIYGLTIS